MGSPEPNEGQPRQNFNTGFATIEGVAVVGAVLIAFVAFSFTLPDDLKRAKICVRSKQMEKEWFADPKKAAWAQQKGIKYLQDPECLEFGDYVDRVKPYLKIFP